MKSLSTIYSDFKEKLTEAVSKERENYHNPLESFDHYTKRTVETAVDELKALSKECGETLNLIVSHFKHNHDEQALQDLAAYTQKLEENEGDLLRTHPSAHACEKIYAYGIHLIKIGNLNHAFKVFRLLITLDIGYSATWVMAGACLNAQKRPDEALNYLKVAEQMDPGSPQTHYHIACAYRLLKQKEPAKEAFQKALELARGEEQFAPLVPSIESALKGE